MRNIIFNILIITFLKSSNDITNPALLIQKQYNNINRQNYIIPYFLTIYAIDMLKHKKSFNSVKNYIIWYANHILDSDKWGLSGTIYDYNIYLNGKEYPINSYDSADGYAGLFLNLVYLYYKETKDKKTIENIWSKIKDVAYLLVYLQDKDGLTWVSKDPKLQIKFLMDNIESYIGLASYIKLSQLLDKKIEPFYIDARDAILNGIFSKFYDKDKDILYWQIENNTSTAVKNNKYYPDIFVQIHLLAFLCDKLSIKLRQKLWKEVKYYIHKYHPPMSVEQKIIYQWANEECKKKSHR